LNLVWNLFNALPKKLMKKTVLVLLLATIYFSGNAQRKARYAAAGNGSGVSIGVEAGLPLGENGKPYSFIIGGSLQYEMRPDADLGLTVNAGYLHYPIKQKYGEGSIGFVPLLAGVKYYFTPTAYFHAQLGAAIGTAKGQGTSFAYSPGLGYKLSNQFDAELKYVGISNSGGTLPNLGLRLAYNF
jgi:hypothetical protein